MVKKRTRNQRPKNRRQLPPAPPLVDLKMDEEVQRAKRLLYQNETETQAARAKPAIAVLLVGVALCFFWFNVGALVVAVALLFFVLFCRSPRCPVCHHRVNEHHIGMYCPECGERVTPGRFLGFGPPWCPSCARRLLVPYHNPHAGIFRKANFALHFCTNCAFRFDD